MPRVTPFNKAIVSGLAGLLTLLVAVMGDNVIDMTEKQQVVTTLVTYTLGVWAVWRVPNAEQKGTSPDNGRGEQ